MIFWILGKMPAKQEAAPEWKQFHKKYWPQIVTDRLRRQAIN